MSIKFDSFHKDHRMISQLCAPGTPLHEVRLMIGLSLLSIFV